MNYTKILDESNNSNNGNNSSNCNNSDRSNESTEIILIPNQQLRQEPPRKRRSPSILKVAGVSVCALVLMIGSGYAGAKIAHNSSHNNIDIYEQPSSNPIGNMPNTNIGLLTDTSHRPLTLPELFEGANPAVVAISTEITGRNAFGRTVTRPASGSGFLISEDGYIVTNDHVIEDASSITILMYDGSQHSATVVGRDPESDLALIKITGNGLPYLTLGDSASIQVGEQVVAIGNPLGEFANSMTVGHISALDRDINIDGVSRLKLQTDAAVNRGNSGGPLINIHGYVIGVVSAKSVGMDVEGLGFAIPSNQTKTVIDQLMEYGYVRGRPILGVQITVQENTGLVQVASVNAGSAAERAGVIAGDIILSANDTHVQTFADLREVIDSLSPGDTLELRIQRGREEITLTATLDEYRPVAL
ncbi:MAG: trypsin-like peptidase domain-containing protein [Defluviitaleaceae bacterium]|nr:trypsin-like peptidase domain-containing protein [Defluviitaleaceae bacterium]